MPEYKFICEPCELLAVVDGDPSQGFKVPRYKICPNCRKRAHRVYKFSTRVIGFGFGASEARAEKFQRKGMEKEVADTFLKESLKNSKERLNSGWQHYSIMEPVGGLHGLAQDVGAKKVSERDSKRKMKDAHEIMKYIDKRGGVNKNNSNHLQVLGAKKGGKYKKKLDQ